MGLILWNTPYPNTSITSSFQSLLELGCYYFFQAGSCLQAAPRPCPWRVTAAHKVCLSSGLLGPLVLEHSNTVTSGAGRKVFRNLDSWLLITKITGSTEVFTKIVSCPKWSFWVGSITRRPPKHVRKSGEKGKAYIQIRLSKNDLWKWIKQSLFWVYWMF